MLEALWSVEFLSAGTKNYGAGVIVLESSKAFGGDSNYFYIGSYELANGILKAVVKVTHYFDGRNSIFGPLDVFTLKLEGKPAEKTFELKGHLVENPGMGIIVQLTKKADLP